MADLEKAWAVLASDVKQCKGIDNLISAKANSISTEDLKARTKKVVGELKESYIEYLANLPLENLSDEKLCSFARYTNGTPLKDYEKALDLVPELVNLVSLADAIPLDGSSLPFDLKKIAVRCRGAVYFAPRRFTAVQLAFDEPRSRVLLFHTGRVVGTGCDSATAAKLAVARALKTIAIEAGVHVGVRRFAVINQVGAISLGAKLDCDGFADTHSSTAHYDPKSFVGLAWRPISECICAGEIHAHLDLLPRTIPIRSRLLYCFAEIYSTGKAKYVCSPRAYSSLAQPVIDRRLASRFRSLPGSRRQRQLLRSFARMAPELLRHSERPELAERFNERLRRSHRPEGHTRQAPRATARKARADAEAAAAASTDRASTAMEAMQSLWEDDDDTCTKTGKATKSNKRNVAHMLGFDECDDNEESAFGDLFDGF